MLFGARRSNAAPSQCSCSRLAAEVRERVTPRLEELVNEKVRLALQAKPDSARNAALEDLLDRLTGRAPPAPPDDAPQQQPVRITVSWDAAMAEPEPEWIRNQKNRDRS